MRLLTTWKHKENLKEALRIYEEKSQARHDRNIDYDTQARPSKTIQKHPLVISSTRGS